MAFMVYACYLMSPRVTRLALKSGYRTQLKASAPGSNHRFLRILCGVVGAFAVIGNSLVQVIGSGNILYVMSHGTIPLWLGELIIVSAIAFYVYKSGLRAIGWTKRPPGRTDVLPFHNGRSFRRLYCHGRS